MAEGSAFLSTSSVPKRLRELAHKPVAEPSITAVQVSTNAAPIIGGACCPIAPPPPAPIVVATLLADPIALVLPPRLRERAPRPTTGH